MSFVMRTAKWIDRVRTAGSGFEGQRYLVKWLFLSSAIGIVAGLGSVVFFYAIVWCTRLFLGGIVGYMPPSPVGEGSPIVVPMARAWLLPAVTALGGLISGLIIFNLAPEAEGHGTDAAIEAIHKKGGAIRARIPIIKLVASAITIGSGGSVVVVMADPASEKELRAFLGNVKAGFATRTSGRRSFDVSFKDPC